MKSMPFLQHLSTESEFKKRGQKRASGIFYNEANYETDDEELIANPLYGYKVKLILSIAEEA